MQPTFRLFLQWFLLLLLPAASPVLAQNLAVGKAALASSAVQAASRAFDGDMSTRWESASSDAQYLIVDLGSVQSIDRIRLSWETAFGKNFTLDISTVTAAPTDANWTNVVNGTWTTAVTTVNNTSTTNDYPNLGKTGRYVRMNGTVRATGYGYSLYEFAIYPYDPNPNLAAGKTPTTSANPKQAAANAFDGNGKTRWESDYTDQQYITVDLGSVQQIDRIRLTWESALGKDFTLDVSDDGTTWTTAVTVTGNTSTSNEYANLGKTGRYVRMNGIARGTVYGYSLYEFEVFAASNNASNIANAKSAVASTTQGTLNANYAIDNDRLTRWASTAGRDDASIYIDLLGNATISRVYLVWEKAYGGDFTIEVSDDTKTWTTVATTVGNSFHFNEYRFETPVTGRYVRMNGTKRGTTIADNGYSLYEFQVNGTIQPLPVTLVSFSAAPQGTAVALSWATASEQHNAGFEVQRSADGVAFAPLTTVAGMGTTQAAHTYRYLDAAPLPTTGYYRLKQLDTDGTFAYSPVVAVQPAASAAALSIYPNPTADRTTVTWEAPLTSAGRWYLTNSTGQVVHTELLTSEMAAALTLDLQPYPVGSYILTVESAGKVLRRARVQKSY
ncbi:discoidin domain-containing protein [Hymenobacter sp. BT559]|uniref:discoidin domain-containing protein n=1 Tax=Hymenobacter sp. BT559 TaxID=2795729 RepID=UPI0018EBF546|nr:discoidin domain-containing protein [Hymenobacter sp. BT559]MBJ6142655.1 discoidin domain-containing protein [Hymenobacter sp. BT559]